MPKWAQVNVAKKTLTKPLRLRADWVQDQDSTLSSHPRGEIEDVATRRKIAKSPVEFGQ